MVQLAYTPCAPKDIAKTLNSFFADLEPEGGFNRATSINQVLLAKDLASLESKAATVQTLSEVRPGKFFELYFLPEGSPIETSVAAHCVALEKRLHVCTEFIRIGGGPKLLSAMMSIVRAHALTGVQSELFLGDWEIDRKLVLGVVQGVDGVMFDSSSARDLDEVVALVRSLPRSVDLLWAGLSIWREQLRSVFEREVLRQMLPNLSAITIECQGRAPTAAWCLAGWMMTQLGLVNSGKSGAAVLCLSPTGKEVRLTVREGQGETGTLSGLNLEFAGGGRVGRVKLARGELESRDELCVTVDIATGYAYRRRFEDESTMGKLKKYLLIGESMTNYVRSLMAGHELRRCLA